VDSFFLGLAGRDFRSELAQSYQLRLIKTQDTLFTFLRHDSVPWNNNSAEHALKCYARYRRVTDGQMTERGLSDYLVLLSVYQTCKYKGVSFLSFLLSGEKDGDKFMESNGKKRRTTDLELYPQGFTLNRGKRKGGRKRKSSRGKSGQSPESPLG
jgi:hypothetical protein